MNQVALKQTAQQQIASALAEIFEGKPFRYWKNGKETWFVAKDLVEAAGGVWHATRFQEIVGDGCTIKTPLKINGISQDVVACTAKVAVKWLAVSRLPGAERLSDLVFDIIGRVMDGDEVNKADAVQTVQQVPVVDSNLVRASQELTAVMTPLATLFTAMGLSKAEKCKAMVQHAMTIGPKHGVGNSLIPESMARYLPTGKSHATVAMASTGGEIVDATALGKLLGKTAGQVNDALVWLGFQARVKLGSQYYYVKLPPADAIADEKLQGPRRKGAYEPTKIVKGWRENLVYPHLQRAFTEYPEGIFGGKK